MRRIAIFFFLLPLLFPSCAKKGMILTWNDPPEIGQSPEGETIFQGGLSAACCAARSGDGWIEFTSLTDRGPNAAAVLDWPGVGKGVRPFVLPDFAPSILRMRVRPETKEVQILERIPLRSRSQRQTTGLPPYSPQAFSPRKMELASDSAGKLLGTDPAGLDPEGICKTDDGSFWISEEYGPDLLHFSAEGMELDRFTPGRGLPEIFKYRRANRGLEGLACAGDRIFAILQSPLPLAGAKNQVVIRIAEFDPAQRRTVGLYLYLLEPQKNLVDPFIVDKVGDFSFLHDRKFLVVEQNGVDGSEGIHNVYVVDLAGARNVLREPLEVEPELMAEAEVRALPVARKKLLVDLVRAGFERSDKVEGLVMADARTLLVLSDNDFGLSALPPPSPGAVKIDPERKSYLGLIPVSEGLVR